MFFNKNLKEKCKAQTKPIEAKGAYKLVNIMNVTDNL